MTASRFPHNCARLFLLALLLVFAPPVLATQPAPKERSADISRIVSIGGDVTEILYALGFAEKIVAVDTTSVYPAEALATKKNVGYMRALSTEGVLSMSPTLILAAEKSGPPEVVSALKASSAPFISIGAPDSPDGVGQRIRAIAAALGAQSKGEELVARVNEKFAKLATRRATVIRPVRTLFLLSLQNGRAVAGGAKTAAHEILALSGAENVASAFEGYKPVSDEAILGLAPDVILVMNRSQQPNGGAKTAIEDEIAAMKGASNTPAARNKRIYEVDGAALLQFAPRTADAALELMTKLYPGIQAADVRK
jgi:iron complex transport system substrate-binding protein